MSTHHCEGHKHSHNHEHAGSGSKTSKPETPSAETADEESAAEKTRQNHSHAHHHHANARKLSKARIMLVLFLSGGFMLVEAVAGFLTGSLALIADAGHMLGDVAALALAYFAIWLSSRPAGPSQTYGYHRSEILAALANSLLLVLISIYVIFEAIQRFSHPPEIHSTQMLIVAVIGLCVNLVSMQVLSDSSENSLNARAAYLEVVSDMLASVGVILAATIMMLTGFYIVDPIISLILSVFILWRTWGLLKESIDILMESAPDHLDPNEISKSILSVDGVVAVHDMHVWTITSGMVSMSSHVIIASNANAELILDKLKDVLEHEFEIAHSTIQLENESARRCTDNCRMI